MHHPPHTLHTLSSSSSSTRLSFHTYLLDEDVTLCRKALFCSNIRGTANAQIVGAKVNATGDARGNVLHRPTLRSFFQARKPTTPTNDGTPSVTAGITNHAIHPSIHPSTIIIHGDQRNQDRTHTLTYLPKHLVQQECVKPVVSEKWFFPVQTGAVVRRSTLAAATWSGRQQRAAKKDREECSWTGQDLVM